MKNMKDKIKNNKHVNEYLNFLRENSVIGLTIGVLVAQISKDLVDSIVKGIFTPFINIIVPSGDLKNFSFIVNGSKFDVGMVINAFLTFSIIMLILYIVLKKILKSDVLTKK